jgi:bifunctional non-homologous end joining protein LigD
MFPAVIPMRLASIPHPFDHPDWIFELKYDGFRTIAHIERGSCRLVSRNRNVYKRFQCLCNDLANFGRNCVLDAEIVCLDDQGRPFYLLLRRRQEPTLVVFDVLELDGQNVTEQPLIERKRLLRTLPKHRRVLYARSLDGAGAALYHDTCKLDLEGIVAKWKYGEYVTGDRQPQDRTLTRLVRNPEAIARYTWLKVKNPTYTQMEGRSRLFEPR